MLPVVDCVAVNRERVLDVVGAVGDAVLLFLS